jgi:6-pyruvoyltetrahydropterin/6-carboxytetrahydropterin synthase
MVGSEIAPAVDTSFQSFQPFVMFSVAVKMRFSAAHYLREYEGNCEKLHGHNWTVELVCQSNKLDNIGMVLDFRLLKKALGEVLGKLDHSFLNELEPFKSVNPSSENIARYIWNEVAASLTADGAISLMSVKVWESEDSWAEYRE